MPFTLPGDVRRACDQDVTELRRLVNAAYKELADLGFNYTGTYQDEEVTRDRMREAEVFLLHRDGELVGSINLSVKEVDGEGSACLYVNQLAIRPDRKRQRLGSYLLDLAEERARSLGLARLRLDTAIPAVHLVEMYRQRGYREISEVQWEGKSYRSYIMEKALNVHVHV